MGDFQPQAAFGASQYYNPDGAFHRFDARSRLLAVIVLLSALTASSSVWGLAFGLVCVILFLCITRIPVARILRAMLRSMVFVLLLVVLQILFSPAHSGFPPLFTWGPFLVNMAGVLRGVKLLLRFSALYLLLNWMTAILSATDIVRALAQLLQPLDRIGVPTHDGVLLVQVALHFLPLLASEVERIAKAQAARGAVWGTRQRGLVKRARQLLPVLLPLFMNTLHRAEHLAQAIEARGYGAGPRTSLVTFHYSSWDSLAIVGTGCVCFVILFL